MSTRKASFCGVVVLHTALVKHEVLRCKSEKINRATRRYFWYPFLPFLVAKTNNLSWTAVTKTSCLCCFSDEATSGSWATDASACVYVCTHRCAGDKQACRRQPPSSRSLTLADDRSSLPLGPLGRQDGRVPLVLSPLLDPREHGGIPQHVRHDAKDDLVSADIQLLQSARLAPYVGLHTVLFVPRGRPRQQRAGSGFGACVSCRLVN